MLRHFDWRAESRVEGQFEVWSRKGQDKRIFLPTNPDAGDYDALLASASQTLLRTYRNAAVDFIERVRPLAKAQLDEVRWDKSTNSQAGIIPWTEGKQVFAAAEGCLLAAAKSTRGTRASHGTASGYLAKHFLERVFMGQTAIGSFVVTAQTPTVERFFLSKSAERQAVDNLDQELSVSGREIVDTLTTSLEVLRSSLDEYKKTPRLEIFEEGVQYGVSAELTRALARLSTGSDAEVAVNFASDESRRGRTASFSFGAVEAEVLEQVTDRFQAANPAQAVSIVGEVSLLDNSSAAPARLIRLDVASGADVRRVRVRLNFEQYDLAVDAHARHQWLRVSGSLERDGRDYWLYNATDVAILKEVPDGGEEADVEPET